ncbi:MAG TPA: aminoglycoside phosphotransferase family protein [Pyrinomonadaceae bacterium]
MSTVAAKAAAWNVTLEHIRETPSSLLGFGVRDDQRVVLKIAKGLNDEAHSGEVLRAFGTAGVVRVYEAELGAVLLERLDPGEELVSLVRQGDDDEPTRILADVIVRLAGHNAPVGTATVADWSRGFDWYVQNGDQQIPSELVQEAHNLYRDLAASQRTTMLLHGDLQHYNVLYDNERGWLAIDPKGVVGELEYEVGALLRNPVELPKLFTQRATVERRLEILARALPLDRSRVLRWCFAQAVLSAIWGVEDGYKIGRNHPALELARTVRSMID